MESKSTLSPSSLSRTKKIHLKGTVPHEVWNRLGTKLVPKLRTGSDLKIEVDFSVTLDAKVADSMESELRQLLQDLGLNTQILIDGEST